MAALKEEAKEEEGPWAAVEVEQDLPDAETVDEQAAVTAGEMILNCSLVNFLHKFDSIFRYSQKEAL